MSDERGFVYFLRASEFGFKIGWTTGAPRRRVTGLQSGSPIGLELIAVLPALRPLERQLHLAMPDFHIRGEWFRKNWLLDVAIECASWYGELDEEGIPSNFPHLMDDRAQSLVQLLEDWENVRHKPYEDWACRTIDELSRRAGLM